MIHYHLPGLFEFYELYKRYLPIYREHREYFYDWCDIGSIYGAPGDCLWGGGRVGFGEDTPSEVLALVNEFGVSARLTFSNSLLEPGHLQDRQCNRLCEMFQNTMEPSGVIVHSDILVEYIRQKYPRLYLVSSTTKVITDYDLLVEELNRGEFKYVVPDFRLNKKLSEANNLTQSQKDKVEFLCNECCYYGCKDRKACYENVSRKVLGIECEDHVCQAPNAQDGYVFSKAMTNPGFIGIEDIVNTYEPMGYSNFKLEGRSLGSALVLEFLLYYMVKPEHQLKVREAIYLDHSLDLF